MRIELPTWRISELQDSGPVARKMSKSEVAEFVAGEVMGAPLYLTAKPKKVDRPIGEVVDVAIDYGRDSIVLITIIANSIIQKHSNGKICLSEQWIRNKFNGVIDG